MGDLEIDLVTDLCPLTIDLKSMSSADVYRADNSDVRNTIMSNYDYIMYGKIYKVQDMKGSKPPRCQIYASFGGLLMLLTGDTLKLEKLELDCNVYLLIQIK